MFCLQKKIDKLFKNSFLLKDNEPYKVSFIPKVKRCSAPSQLYLRSFIFILIEDALFIRQKRRQVKFQRSSEEYRLIKLD